MPGTSEGNRKGAATRRKLYGSDHFKELNRKRKSRRGFQDDNERAIKGGKISRKGLRFMYYDDESDNNIYVDRDGRIIRMKGRI